ncbi:MAG: hypothetical protein CM1200mP11_3030 [Nitrosopumilaceae archaeon]|nr:MAG: hypothetical protein CM1200mP11_3030 [Nitrosopumilaceae archaeon]
MQGCKYTLQLYNGIFEEEKLRWNEGPKFGLIESFTIK